jgi:hypothetical protein
VHSANRSTRPSPCRLCPAGAPVNPVVIK